MSLDTLRGTPEIIAEIRYWTNGLFRAGPCIPLKLGYTIFCGMQGDWLADMYHGQGTMHHASGVCYAGTWENGLPTGTSFFSPARLSNFCPRSIIHVDREVPHWNGQIMNKICLNMY